MARRPRRPGRSGSFLTHRPPPPPPPGKKKKKKPPDGCGEDKAAPLGKAGLAEREGLLLFEEVKRRKEREGGKGRGEQGRGEGRKSQEEEEEEEIALPREALGPLL